MRNLINDTESNFGVLVRSFRCLLPTVVLRGFDSAGNKGPSQPGARVCRGNRLQNTLVLTLTFVLIAASVVEVRAGQQPAKTSDIVLSPDMTKWSPELKGGQWGWHLTTYSQLEWFFHVNGMDLIMLSTDSKSTDNVLWDPLTGAGLHLNFDEYNKFNDIHKDERYSRIPDPFNNRMFPLGNEWMLQAQLSPHDGSCLINFDYYLNIYDKSQTLARSFYVVVKLRHPIKVTRNVCAEGDSGPHPFRHAAIFRYDTELSTYYVALRDGSVLFIIYDGVSTRITRLDKTLRQHSSVDGHIFILDAEPINEELRASNRIEDSRFRYEVILKKIEALKIEALKSLSNGAG